MIPVWFLLAQTVTQAPATTGAGFSPTQWLIWGVVLLAVAAALFFVEVFLPTGGIIGAASGLAAVAGIVCLFWRDSTLGLFAATGVILLLPFAIAFALKVAPDTPFAKWVTLSDRQEARNRRPASDGADVRTPGVGAQTVGRASIRVGDTGKTLTPLFPVGTCLIDGRREECLARRGTIAADTPVRVVVVEGDEVYVSAVETLK